MRRVYSQSSDQMKNSAIGRPNCRTASVRRNSETKLAITAGTSAASKPVNIAVHRFALQVHRLVGAVRGECPAGQPAAAVAVGSIGGQQGGQRVRLGQRVVVHDPDGLTPQLHRGADARRQSRPHRPRFSPGLRQTSPGIASVFI